MAKTLTLMFLCAILLFGVVHAIYFDSPQTIRVELGPHKFNIPRRYSRESPILQVFKKLPGLDGGSRDFLLEFPAEEIARAVPGFQISDGRFKEDIRAILAGLTPNEVERYIDSERFRDLWEATNSFQERIVEPYSGYPWFKIYRKVDYPDNWTVLIQRPESNRPLPDDPSEFWLAHCRTSESPITKSGKITRCDSHAFSGDIVIDFFISEDNLYLIDDVRTYLITQVESWRVE